MEELPKHPQLKAHAITVMYAVTSIIDNLDNNDVLINLLQKTAISHRRRKIPAEAFDVSNSVKHDLRI